MVLDDNLSCKFCRSRIRQRQYSFHQWVSHSNLTCCSKFHIIPDTDVTSAHCRNPVPTDSGMERRIIRTKDTTVEVRTLFVLFLDCADMVILYNLNSNNILASNNSVSYIKLATHECTFDSANLFSVKINISLPVDTVEVQEHTFFLEIRRNFKFITIPEIRIEE